MKTKTTTKPSHTQRIRGKFASNLLTILKQTGLTEGERFWFKTETGCLFLEEIYPKETKYEEFVISHKKNSLFWDWFGFVWAKWEADYLRLKTATVITEDDYKTDFVQLICDRDAQHDFYDIYLNQMINGH